MALWQVLSKPYESLTAFRRSEALNALNFGLVRGVGVTGGTKSMSTHVYLTLSKVIENENIFFSYLDARNFRLITDNDNHIVERNLRKMVSIPFENMIGLHGYELIEEEKISDIKHDIALLEKFIDKNSTKECINSIKQINGGKWLEGPIADKLEIIAKDRSEYIEIKKGVQIKHPGWVGGRSSFEMDVIMVCGYQLTGISCYVGDKTEKCKQKGFEIILRTRQIGGDESRAILM